MQLFIIFPLISFFTMATCLTCNTPEEWLSGDSLIQKGVGYLIPIDNFDNEKSAPKIWPNGIVKYKLHSSLTLKDKSEVQKAFDEYHKKICIRFHPWAKGDPEATSALTNVLDMDAVNTLYNCRTGECHRHRWISAATLSHENMENMHTFGYQTKDGMPMYPCRAPINGEIAVVGMYDDSRKVCQIPGESQVHKVSNGVEVLIIPGGLRKDCNVYSLVDKANVSYNHALAVGESFKHHGSTFHIAYASITKADGSKEYLVGNVWADEYKGFENEALVTNGTTAHKANEYKILTCNLDTACMIMQWYDDSRECD